MASINGLPVYYIKINEDLSSNQGIDFVSLVDIPAIETNWIAMADNKKPMKFATNEDKQLLYGPILIPDLPIYRYDKKIGEYYVVFTKEEIVKLVRKFQTQQKTINLNYQHQDNSKIDGAVIQEIWLTGKTDKSQDLGFDLPEGTAFVCSYIGNKEFWLNEVKTGNVMGYSIEGFLDMEIKQNKNKMNKHTFVSATTKEGLIINSPDEQMAVGSVVTTTNESGAEVAVPDGEYTLESGQTVVVVGGVISEIKEAETTEDELNTEEVAAMSKMFSAILKPLNDKIAELEVKLSNIPASESVIKKEDEVKEIQLSATQTAIAKVEKFKAALKNINKNK
jgi:hypothetical protein